MPQSLVKILVHVVFSTKDRVKIITPEIEPQLFGYIGGIVRNNNARMIIAGGTSDHCIFCFHSDVSIWASSSATSNATAQTGSRSRINDSQSSTGSGVMERFPSGNLRSPPYRDTFEIKKNIINNKLFRTNFASCAASTTSRSTSDIVGIDCLMLN